MTTEDKHRDQTDVILKRLRFHPAHLIGGIVFLTAGISLAFSFAMLVWYADFAASRQTPAEFDAFEDSRDCAVQLQFLLGPFASSQDDTRNFYWGYSPAMSPYMIMFEGDLSDECKGLLDFSLGDQNMVPPNPVTVRGRSVEIDNTDLYDFALEYHTALWPGEELDRNGFKETVGTHYLDTVVHHGLGRFPWYGASLIILLPAILIMAGIVECVRFGRQCGREEKRLSVLGTEELAAARKQLEGASEYAPPSKVYVTADFLITGNYQFDVIPFGRIENCERVGRFLIVTTEDGMAHIVMADRKSRGLPTSLDFLKNTIDLKTDALKEGRQTEVADHAVISGN